MLFIVDVIKCANSNKYVSQIHSVYFLIYQQLWISQQQFKSSNDFTLDLLQVSTI